MKSLNQIQNKIVSKSNLLSFAISKREAGETIVFTNGCFDILHKGHVEYLAQAADLADILIVGINSDDSVRRQNKGDNRPINSFEARATLLAALGFVNAVVSFEEDTPMDLIKVITPDVLVKGADYNPNEEDKSNENYIVGREIVLEAGGTVKVISLVEGYSTTDIINKLQK
jgi:D-glycero-beta-D-manno-heptose 1-phosphate adenylyltransferase